MTYTPQRNTVGKVPDRKTEENAAIHQVWQYPPNSNPVQSSGYLVSTTPLIIKFSSRMEHRQYGFQCRYSRGGMKIGRNSSTIVDDGTGSIFVDRGRNKGGVSRQGFIHTIIHNFPYQMMQSIGSRRSNVHSGSFPDGIQSTQDGDLSGIVRSVFSAPSYLLYSILLLGIFGGTLGLCLFGNCVAGGFGFFFNGRSQ